MVFSIFARHIHIELVELSQSLPIEASSNPRGAVGKRRFLGARDNHVKVALLDHFRQQTDAIALPQRQLDGDVGDVGFTDLRHKVGRHATDIINVPRNNGLNRVLRDQLPDSAGVSLWVASVDGGIHTVQGQRQSKSLRLHLLPGKRMRAELFVGGMKDDQTNNVVVAGFATSFQGEMAVLAARKGEGRSFLFLMMLVACAFVSGGSGSAAHGNSGEREVR